jgi:PqqD family protein of HPr-rel-A system
MSATPPQHMPHIGDGIEYVIVDGEAVLYDAARCELHRLNATATRIWEHCDGRASVAVVTGQLARGADVEHAVIERDVLAYVAELEARGLVSPD